MHRSLSRRDVFKLGASGLAVLHMPQLALAELRDGVFELRAMKSRVKLAGENHAASDLWLYNGETPGPEIRVKRGQRVQVRFTNQLDHPTSVHWHGIRIANSMDGVSGLTQDPVPPGGTFAYDFVVPDAGTFWYHAHTKSWEQVARGLYGPLIVDELESGFDRAHDLTLMIDDWRLGNDGALHVASLGAFRDWSHAGRLGNWLTVNGRSEPEFKLNSEENYRLRLINASNARVLQISPKTMNARILGFDGFSFAKPRQHNSEYLAIAPAQRVDLLISSQNNGDVALNDIGDFALQELSGREALSIAKFKFSKTATRQPAKPVVLTQNAIDTPDLKNAVRVPLVMTGGAMGRLGDVTYKGKKLNRGDYQRTKQVWAFNGVANLADEPLFRVERGQSVIVETENRTGWLHGMHVHGHHFLIVSRNGLQERVRNWRDTFVIDRDETVEIAFVADNPGKWLLHCHMLEHAAAGMRTWFEVV